MPKISFILIIACILTVMSCKTEPEPETNQKPENVFAGHEWENTDQYVISFTKDKFHLRERYGYPNDFQYREYNGTYSLFYELILPPPFNPDYEERIEFVCDDPMMNGVLRYKVETNNDINDLPRITATFSAVEAVLIIATPFFVFTRTD